MRWGVDREVLPVSTAFLDGWQIDSLHTKIWVFPCSVPGSHATGRQGLYGSKVVTKAAGTG
jgi:hypothetical protein